MTKMFKKLCSNPLKSFDIYVKNELEEIISSLEHLLSLKDALGLEPTGRSNYLGVKTRVSERPRLTPVADESTFCGRKDIKETIIHSLLSGEKIGIVPIIGAGGLGKTTLAQIIYNHPDVRKHFPVRAWVIVSTEFDLPAITKKILGKVGSSSEIDGNEDELPFKLKDALEGKKFLLVLDDVWSEDRYKWNTFKSYFQSGKHGSKVIVTTRSQKVASIVAPNQPHHVLPVLPEEDCLKLFDQTVFSDGQDLDAYRHLQEIGKKIVNKCKGNPLAVICVGGILCGEWDPEKWEKVLQSSVWELLQKDSEGVIPSLWLSYRYLPSHLKRCFAYCSIFPKDYLFRKEQMVQLWMAEGFLKNGPGGTMEEVGKQYFEDLISRSLFQRSSDDEETIMMHDLVHDLAMYVSGKFCFWLDEDKMLRDLACETRHLSYNFAIGDEKKFEGLSKAKRLHSFVGLRTSAYRYGEGENFDILKVLEGVSMVSPCLRVLSLSSPYYKIDSLPDSMGKLKHLRYLNLSETSVTKLPDSVGTLYNLQTLLLSRCRNLTRLPSNLGSLINLYHLDTSDSPLEEMPPKMCNLKKLHTLTDFVLGKQSGSSIKDLGVLQDLHGRIRVSGLQNVNNVDDALKANLKNKKNLSEVALEWEGQSQERDSGHEEKVLEALQPHANLKKLFISEYGGTGFPNWVGDSSFSKIETMHLNNCEDGLFLPALGRLPSLKELKIKGFHGVTTDVGFYGDDSPFRLLEVLHLEDMPEWNCWSFIQDDKDSVFPRLKEFQLKGCPKLVGGLPNCNTITTLRIEYCKNFDFPGNQCGYPSLKSLYIKASCGSMKSFPLDHFPMLNALVLKELEWLVGLTGESHNELEELSLKKCSNLEFNGNSHYRSLKYLKIVNCEALKSIPLDYFPKLKHFILCSCQNFESFRFGEEPPLVLKYLFLCDLPKFVSFPEGGLPAPNLENFTNDECENLRSLPQQMHRLLPSLNFLEVENCGEIESWPEGGLESLVELTGESHNELEELSLETCSNLEFLGNNHYVSLKNLEIYNCEALKSIPLDYFPKLKHFILWQCQNFESFRFGEEPPLVLEFLSLCGLPKFVSFPEGGLPAPNLKNLTIDECENLRSLPQQMHRLLPSLNVLMVTNCGEIESWPEGGLPSNLELLKIGGCRKLAAQVMHWDLQTLTPCLKSFSIDGCGEELFDSFPPEGLLPTSLTNLSIIDFRCLKTLNIHAFQNLKVLYLYKCGELPFLPEESLPKSLSFLCITVCPLLERRYQKETGEGWHKISHIPAVQINWREQHKS